MCLSVATDLHTGERANTCCLGGSIICLGVATDLNTGKRARTGCRVKQQIYTNEKEQRLTI